MTIFEAISLKNILSNYAILAVGNRCSRYGYGPPQIFEPGKDANSSKVEKKSRYPRKTNKPTSLGKNFK